MEFSHQFIIRRTDIKCEMENQTIAAYLRTSGASLEQVSLMDLKVSIPALKLGQIFSSINTLRST